MTIDELISVIGNFPVVTDDTREMVSGGVFVYGGGRSRQDEFLEMALARGAAIIVSETDPPGMPESMLVRVQDRRIASADLARAFYRYPDADLILVGVTGTCGKTTTTYLLDKLLAAAGHRVGVIGTEAIRYGAISRPSPNTTPSSFVLNRVLREMADAGCSAVAMEVSSHAIEQERTHGIAFDGAIFTNLSVEHLDLHGSMEAYYSAKARLFLDYADLARSRGKTMHAVINHDSEHGRRLYDDIRAHDPGGTEPVMFGLSPLTSGYDGSQLEATKNGIAGAVIERIEGTDAEIAVRCPLIGRFNAENVLGAIALVRRLGLDRKAIASGLERMEPAPGRMTQVLYRAGVSVVVDYAHKPGALEVVLETLRPLTPGKLICVFGCGGQRDRAKRSVMGRVAAAGADRVIVTADNARGESFDAIAGDILAGIPPQDLARISIIPDRRDAIVSALRESESGDTVLIAGRGAEPRLDTIAADGSVHYIDFDDRFVAAQAAAYLLES